MSVPAGRTAARDVMSRAVVSAGDEDTAYRRAGRGPVVVVLGFVIRDQAELPQELAPLVSRCRIVVPDHQAVESAAGSPIADGTPFAAWLHGFLEGLGVAGVRVVAREAYGGALAQHAARHPGDVARVALIGDASPGAEWAAVALAIADDLPSGPHVPG